MELLIVRHEEAEERTTGSQDEDRRLTARGKRRMGRAAKGLRTVVKEIDTIATSPLVRAVQTGRILAGAYGVRKPRKLSSLEPMGDRNEVLAWLQEQGENETVALVGHKPHLGLLASWLLAAPLNHFVEFKKGGACLLAWPDSPAPGNGWLKWAMTPSQLRKLAPS